MVAIDAMLIRNKMGSHIFMFGPRELTGTEMSGEEFRRRLTNADPFIGAIWETRSQSGIPSSRTERSILKPSVVAQLAASKDIDWYQGLLDAVAFVSRTKWINLKGGLE